MTTNQNSEIPWALIIGIAGLILSVMTYLYVRDKDKTELIEKTKIVMCEVGQVIHSKQSSKDQATNKEEFNKEFDHLEAIDLKNIDGELLEYIIKVQGVYNYTKEILYSDNILPIEKAKILTEQLPKYETLLDGYEKLKEKLQSEYKSSFNCYKQ